MDYFLLLVVSLLGSQVIAQDCSTTVCPVGIPSSSDVKGLGGSCSIPEAASTRSAINGNVMEALTGQNPLSPLRNKYLGLHPDAPAGSCSNIYRANPAAANNGYYYLRGDTPSYCRFDLSTDGDFDEFGWERFVLVDMREPNATCPGDLQRVISNDVAYCRRNTDNAGCAYIFWPTMNYVKRMYGRIYGIQMGTPDIDHLDRGIDDDTYVDGVSLTYRRFPNREHIWTFIGYTSAAFPNCPCSTSNSFGDPRTTPTFIGEDYFCESGTDDPSDFTGPFTDDPIWDAINCEATQVDCCNRGPWFYREFNTGFLDDVELRLCLDSNTDDEDLGLQLIELWVQE